MPPIISDFFFHLLHVNERLYDYEAMYHHDGFINYQIYFPSDHPKQIHFNFLSFIHKNVYNSINCGLFIFLGYQLYQFDAPNQLLNIDLRVVHIEL